MKAKELNELSLDELKTKFSQEKSQYETEKLSHKVTPIQNPLQLRAKRRFVARIATLITLKSKEQK